jgi:hypothetical protein
MDGRCCDSGNSIHRRTGTRREVAFGLGSMTLDSESENLPYD